MKNRQSFDNEGFDNLGFLLSKVRHAIIQVRFKDNIVSASQDPRWETPTN
jgi:predicted Zn-dependent protease